MPTAEDRWPPVYDADELVELIRGLVQRADAERFYEWRGDHSMSALEDVCQGDIVELTSGIPVIGSDGEPGVLSHDGGHWMVIGNSCDFSRDHSQVPWTQFIPVIRRGAQELSAQEVAALRSYSGYRRFYLPSWTVRFLARDDGRYAP